MKKRLVTLLFSIVSALTLSSCGIIMDAIITPSEDQAESIEKEDLSPEHLTISKTSVTMGLNQSIELYSTITNKKGHRSNVQDIAWSSSNTDALSVTRSYNGQVCTLNSKSVGTYKVTASYGSKTQECVVTIKDSYVPETKSLEYTYSDYIKNNNYLLSSAPTLDAAKLLIIPIWFTDSDDYILPKYKETVRSDIELAYLGSEGETGWHSVKTFYETESRGKLSLTGTVTKWYECGYSSSKYYTEDTGLSNTVSLVNKAVEWYKREYQVSNLSDYDMDKDGYLDGVMLIYGAPDSSAYKHGNDNMWAYCYWLQDKSAGANKTNPNPNCFFWASYDFMYSSTRARSRTGTTYGSGDTRNINVDSHTYIHEMGHVFGLQDYYDYSSQSCPAGGFSMQDYNVGAHDPHSRLGYGWDNVIIPTQNCDIHVSPYEQSGDLILLSNHQSDVDSPFDEYILLELYTPTGLNKLDTSRAYQNNYPTGASVPGFRIWHVDARLLYLTSRNTSNPPFSASKVTTRPTNGRYYELMMSNTYYKAGSSSNGYCSPLGQAYANYNILQLIRNNTLTSYKPGSKYVLDNDSLFISGSFSIDTYSSQFYQTGKMNTNQTLGWKVTFSNVNSSGADVKISTYNK